MKARSLAMAGAGVIFLQVGLVCSAAYGQIETSRVSIQVSGGRMTARVKNAPLGEVLGVLARQTGIQIVLHPPSLGDERLTTAVHHLPVEEGVRRILRHTNALFIYSEKSSSNPLAPPSVTLQAVQVYAQSTGPSQSLPGPLPGPPAPSKADAAEADTTNTHGMTSDAAAVLLDARNSSLRTRAATTLAETYDPSTIGPLAQALAEDEDATVRLSVVKAMGRLRSEQAVAPLAGALAADSALEVREATTDALAKTWSTTAVAPLVQALHQDPSALVREAAARALGGTWDEAAIDPLVQALSSDPNPRVRESAAQALGVLGDSRAVTAVANALSDVHPWVREQAAAVLAVLLKR